MSGCSSIIGLALEGDSQVLPLSCFSQVSTNDTADKARKSSSDGEDEECLTEFKNFCSIRL